MADPDKIAHLLDKYREILAGRRQRYACDSVFSGRKREFEKALLEGLDAERDPERAAALVDMYAELASFLPQADMDLVELCQRRGEQAADFHAALELIATGDHEAIQKLLEAMKIPELTRYYALHRRVVLESSARRQQAESIKTLTG